MGNKIVFIDVETTGLNSELHEIIEIAIIGAGVHYNKKIKPLHIETANPVALKINGYNDFEWHNAIHPQQAAEEISDILHAATIIGHNVRFDMDFVDELLHRYDCHTNYDRRLIDTITLAHEHLTPCGLQSISLDSCRAFFGWSMLDNHTALKDAQDAMRLYYKLSRSTRFKRFVWSYKHHIKSFVRVLL